jgi:PDZ domain-containing protein
MLVRFTIVSAALAALVCLAPRGFAQTNAGPSRQSSAARSQDDPTSPSGDSDQTLEIAPRVAPPSLTTAPPAEPATESPPAADNAEGESGSGSTAAAASGSAPAPDNGSSAANQKRPYLGASVQYIYSDDTPGRVVQGLEVVSVDPKSPAERAGLHGRGAMTKMGATGATASVLAPPLDLVLMPLLRRAGALGATGDLIIAIDDQPVQSDKDLGNALAPLKPGDTVYFTIARTMPDYSHKTYKIPVKLGDPSEAVTEASGDGASASSGVNEGAGVNAPAQSR